MMKKIVVGITDTETSQRAAKAAVELAEAVGASVHFVTTVGADERDVIQVSGERWEFSTIEAAEAKVTEFVRSLGPSIDYTIAALEGSPATLLVREAERIEADLIVVGSVRMQGVGRVLGSVGNHVAHHAPCDVLIVKTV
jgi:nucleotide-binding universal stress UspA family protein